MSPADWAEQAETDLRDIYLWISRRDNRRRTARSVVREIRRKCDEYASAYAEGSTLGTSRTDIGEGVRIFTHKRWVVVFRPMEAGIEVMRVLDGNRDFTRIFGG